MNRRFSSFYQQKKRSKLFKIALSDFTNRQSDENLYLSSILWIFLEEKPASIIYMKSECLFIYQCKNDNDTHSKRA